MPRSRPAGQDNCIDNVCDSSEELPSTVSHFDRIDIPVTSDELEEFHTVLKIVDKLGLFIDISNISAIVIHVSKHPEKELVLKDVFIN